MGPNFSPVIAFHDGKVIAMGPLGWDQKGYPDFVEELRVWIYQPSLPTEPTVGELVVPEDAAASDRQDSGVPRMALQHEPGVCWMLPLQKITTADFTGDRRAFAVAIAQFS